MHCLEKLGAQNSNIVSLFTALLRKEFEITSQWQKGMIRLLFSKF
jgi:hypothetical protein